MGDLRCSKIRNICILAHVDHGKTTLADHLIAACGGGVLHPKLAGRLRYMDYLDEEQRRAITMKSSSIALHYLDYNINLIDSPGHMDFCSEVSTAARLSDGALVLVDAVEGVHIQTHAVLRQAWVEKLTPCLVLNKIDRLITELKLSPMEAYNRLQRIVHEVNSIVSAYKSEKYLSDVDSLLAGASGDVDLDMAEVEDDEEVMFQPQKGNVAFVCALDGWGFRLSHFAQIYASKLGASTAALLKGLWGPRYYHPKKMMIVGKKMIEGVSKDPQPMFVQFVLKPLWQVYQAALEADGDKKMLDKVISTFNLSVPQRELQNKDPKVVLQAVMSRWLPLSDSILSMVVNCMPDPISAQSTRISRLLPKRELALDDASRESEIFRETEYARKCIESCDSSVAAPCVAFVSKMFAVPFKMLPQKGPNGELLNNHPTGEPGESDECFLAFARIFSGVLHSKQKVFVLSAVYDPMKGESMQRHVQEAELQSLYLMMGQGLVPVSSATAGNLVAIQGLGQCILKSATLSSTKSCWPFSSMMFQVAPTLRVAIEPSNPADMGALLKGLRLLNRADPFVEITVSSRGEQVLAAAGEVHLERCIKDLKERFAKVNLEVSPPLVSFKETIEGEGIDLLEHSKAFSCSTEYVEKTTPNGRCVIRVQVLKLPRTLTKVLEECRGILEDIFDGQSRNRDGSLRPHSAEDDGEPVARVRKRIVEAIESELELISKRVDKDKVERCRRMWYHFLGRMWSFGPSQVGPNIFLVPDPKADNIASFNQGQRGMLIRGSCDMSRRLQCSCNGPETDSSPSSTEEPSEEFESLRQEAESLKSSIVSGFQLATAAGPLCDEPMWGLAFLVEPYIFLESSDGSNQSDQYGILSGQVMTAVKEACRTAVLQNKPRLVEAMYFCELHTPTEYLGAMYGVLGKMRARVLKEEMQEGSSLFTVHAYVPVAESFGFADELRKRTSGAVSALLVLSHWEELSEDPFFIPKSEEEIEEFGDGSSVLPNMARKLMNSVRRRKGLHVEEKVVQHATKQRTLARKV